MDLQGSEGEQSALGRLHNAQTSSFNESCPTLIERLGWEDSDAIYWLSGQHPEHLTKDAFNFWGANQ